MKVALNDNTTSPASRNWDALWNPYVAKNLTQNIKATIQAIAIVTILLFGIFLSQSSQASESSHKIIHAEFTANGEVKLPNNWRSWVFLGANLTPNGLNNGKAVFPEFHYTYMEPSAWEYYKRTGTFADGTQIVKELVMLGESEFADGSVNSSVGRGFYAGTPIVVALEYKDTKRFPNKPGGWSFYSFGNGQPYTATASAHTDEQCAACHAQVKNTDYVFVQHYPVLLERKSLYAPVRLRTRE